MHKFHQQTNRQVNMDPMAIAPGFHALAVNVSSEHFISSGVFIHGQFKPYTITSLEMGDKFAYDVVKPEPSGNKKSFLLHDLGFP
jgi:hypothetical protein